MGVTVRAETGDSLLEVIREAGLELNADCGGVGRCGKCAVLVNGKKRLACKTHIMQDIEVEFRNVEAEKEYAILKDYQDDYSELIQTGAQGYSLAVDIGTTTVVGKLIDLSSGLEVASFAQLNAQRIYGADVISRINESLDDASTLQSLIVKQLDQAIVDLLHEHDIAAADIRSMVVAGNTTMTYLLLGLPCRSLGFVPFQPAFIYDESYPYEKVFGTSTLDCPCYMVPFISAYVGGDLTSGLISLGEADNFILMDMGTNGELIFKRGDQLICTATAAGPAFEGANIECGCGSMRGAISEVRLVDGKWEYKTIGASAPCGICGSGILDLMAELLKAGLVDSTGMMSESLDDNRVVLADAQSTVDGSPVFFTQRDVRQFQLAKGAVRTGLEVIMEEMGGEIPAHVFLAGGFWQNLKPESALACGLLPPGFAGRVSPVGNSSLSGAVKLCLNASARADMAAKARNGQEINLGVHPHFNDYFMNFMSFV
jgi:uncharacterized 2Fe-2S/4Fe-4S cluster protein (DUF4445 family)